MASSENKRELILTRSPGRLNDTMSLPAIVGMVVIGLYTFVDAIYAGQLIGVDAMGAVSIAYPFTFINSGLAAMIGKGERSPAVAEAIVRNGAAYFAAVGGAGALIARCIRSAEVVAFDELGCESVKKMVVEDLPLTVAIDAQGNDLYRIGRKQYRR